MRDCRAHCSPQEGCVSEFLAVGGDPQQSLENVNVPSYSMDTSGVIRWLNPAGVRVMGDVRGRHYTSVVAPEDRRRADDAFARKLLGTAAVTDSKAVLVANDGTRVAVEISSVPLVGGGRVVGGFGQFVEQPHEPPSEPHPHLTPRQAQVLSLLTEGYSTKQIARELHLSTETVRNHVRHLLRALG